MSTTRQLLVSFLALATTLTANARHAEIRTRDHLTLQGETTSTPNGSLLIATPSQSLITIPLTNLAQLTFTPPTTNTTPRYPQIILRNASLLPAEIQTITDTAAKFRLNNHPITIPTAQIASVLFATTTNTINTTRPGVLLPIGDFLESRLLDFQNKILRVHSTLYGTRALTTPNQATALHLRAATEPTNTWRVTTHDGLLFHTGTITLTADQLLIRDTILGPFQIPLHQLHKIQNPQP